MDEAPRLRVHPFTTEGTAGSWTVLWRIANEDDQAVRLLSAQHPHSQFRTPKMDLGVDIDAGATANVALPVRFAELPGVIVENPFLILIFRRGGADFRLLARVRVTAGPNGEPLAGQSVVVTTQRV